MVNPGMRRLVGGLVAACGIVLSSFAVGLGGASAVPPGIPDQEDPPGDEAETTSTVRMKERCIWYVDGVPASINLLPTGDDVAGVDGDGDPIGKVYDGSVYSLSVDLPELRAWNSGNESGGGAEFVEEHAFCTYFGATTGIAITGTWSEGGFTATAFPSGRDDNLDFGMTSVNPLAMTIDKGTCRTPSQGPESAWQFGGGGFLTDGESYLLTKDTVTSALGGRLMEQPKGVTTDRPANASGGNDRCGVNLSVQVSIPEGGRPQYAGEAYTFSGPTFTTEIVIDSGGE
jgi:hypothetical protein